MASAAVDHLIEIIKYYREKEASLLAGIHDELNDLKSELESMKSFLRDAETKQLKSQGEKTWVANVRDIAYQAEDIIDEFMYYMYEQQYEQQHESRFTWYLYQIIRMPKNLWLKHRIASKLQQINKAIKAIPERNQRYGIDYLEGSNDDYNISALLYQRDSSIFMKEDDVVGMETESLMLKSWLLDEEQLQRTVISVVGMGGSGKTTLVAKTFNNETMKSHFDCYAWITVSQTYRRDELFKSLIKEFHKSRKEQQLLDLSNKAFKELGEILISYLEHKKYLLVLDDVWDTNLWDAINVALPGNQLGSRIVLTTRKEDVGSFSSSVSGLILFIQPLKKSEAWDLFCKKAFSTYSNKSCPRDHVQLAEELVDKCEGLPLALATLGGLMSSKKSITEWQSVRDNLNWQLNNSPELAKIKSILLLSFNDLPYPLKHCFLYCCLFPEDYFIRRKRLIRLWITEGFVPQVDRTPLAEVAETYLMELIFRSMLQVVERNEYGRPKACKMHDLFRELALSISEREKFCTAYDGSVAIEECNARRLSIQMANYDGDLESYNGLSKLRSLFLFVTHPVSFSNALLSIFKFLRTLDFENAAIDKLPDGLETLFNLRYLNLKGTQVSKLPEAIGKLRNLETLNISDTQIKELPEGVAELQNLLYLIMYHYNRPYHGQFQYVRGTRAPLKFNKLKKLQVMSAVEAEGDTIRQLGSMTRLTSLGISNVRAMDEMDLYSSIQNLKLLRYLFLMASSEGEFLRIDAMPLPSPHLRKFILAGKLERVPDWIGSLQYLTCLSLNWSRLEEDVLPRISALPNLGWLKLVNAFIGENLHFSKGFPKLRSLVVWNFPQLRVITIENGVMPGIQELWLYSCLALNAMPHGIEFLTDLQQLRLESCSLALTSRIKDEESKEWSKVQHIPKLRIWMKWPRPSFNVVELEGDEFVFSALIC